MLKATGEHARAYVPIGEKAAHGLGYRRSRRWGRRGSRIIHPIGHGWEGTRIPEGGDSMEKGQMSGKSLQCSQGQEASSEGCAVAGEVDLGLPSFSWLFI